MWYFVFFSGGAARQQAAAHLAVTKLGQLLGNNLGGAAALVQQDQRGALLGALQRSDLRSGARGGFGDGVGGEGLQS